jgi:hypothetical protein
MCIYALDLGPIPFTWPRAPPNIDPALYRWYTSVQADHQHGSHAHALEAATAAKLLSHLQGHKSA